MGDAKAAKQHEKRSYDDEISSKNQIADMLSQAFRDGEPMEVLIGNQVTLFFSEIEGEPVVPAEGAENTTAEMSTNIDYLKKHEFLWLDSLEPEEGNELVEKHPDVPLTLRFFHGMTTLEGVTRFVSKVALAEGRVLKLAFPEKLGRFRQRRHYRVRTIVQALPAISVQTKTLPATAVKMVDMSIGGVGIASDLKADQLPLDTPVTLLIQVSGEPDLSIKGKVRSTCPAPRNLVRSGFLRKGEIRFGIQFEIPSAAVEKIVNQMVGRLQQIYLASRRRDEPEPARKAPSGKAQALSEALKQKQAKKGWFS
ncbi:MAG: PilZ domain-containing protein [Magnetococcales bacterium]|nr:PilZ domain-containing protein [Magnetococcales bacterium]